MKEHFFEDLVDDEANLDEEQAADQIIIAGREKIAWFDQTKDKRHMAKELWQLYLQNKPAGFEFGDIVTAEKFSSCVRRPVIQEALDSIHAQQFQSLLPAEERFFDTRARNKFAKDNKLMYEEHIENRLEQINFMMKVFNDKKNEMFDGTSAVACPFNRTSEERVVYEFPTLFGIPVPLFAPRKRTKSIITFEGTDFIPLSFEDWCVDPTVDNMDDTAFIWQRYMLIDELRNIDGFRNTEKLKSYKEQIEEIDQDRRLKFAYNGIQHDRTRFETDYNDHFALVTEKWGDFWINGKHYPNHLLVFANDNVFLYFGKNPYDHKKKPFLVSSYISVPGSLYGKSAGQDSIPLAHAYDDLLNNMMDILNKCARPSGTYLQDDEALSEYFSNRDVTISPDELVPVESHDSIRFFDIPLNNLVFLNETQRQLKEEIRESIGGVPYTTGGVNSNDQKRTLGEVEILASGTSTRFENNNIVYEKTKLEPFMAMFFENDRQFMTEPVLLETSSKVLHPNLVKVMDLTFNVSGSKSILQRNQQIEDKLFFYNNILLPGIQAGFIQVTGDQLQINLAEYVRDLGVESRIKSIDERLTIASANEVQAQVDDENEIGALLNGQGEVPQVDPGAEVIPLEAVRGTPLLADTQG